MSVDYDVEYNNRARVPEHGEIFARWAHEAAAYRERMTSEENTELGLAYGASPRQKVDLFFPDATGHTPLALFVHGGYWRSLDPQTFSQMSAGLNARGVAVAVAGSMRWWGAPNRASSCARAASSRTTGASAVSRRATRQSPAPTISPCSTR